MGTAHRVREENKTNTKYDSWSYRELLVEARERKVYRKDMKKDEMAWALRDDDLEREQLEHMESNKRQREDKERRRREQQRAAEEHKKYVAAKQQRRDEKEDRRQRGESVSDDTMSENEVETEQIRHLGIDEYTNENFGQSLDDNVWDSTSTESSTKSVSEPIYPNSKIRIFEWPFPYMPPNRPSAAPSIQGDLDPDFEYLEPSPLKIPYTPLKVITTVTKEELLLPGWNHREGVEADFAPILSPETKRAARNGHLQGLLQNCTIERGTEWAKHTQVQGWNGRMYFNLPPRDESKDLADVYRRWSMVNKKLLRVKGHGDGLPADREKRHAQRRLNKGKRSTEVYEASQYRPTAICYLAAFLDLESDAETEETPFANHPRSLDNLFFLRFRGCHVPHYYSWCNDETWINFTMQSSTLAPVVTREQQVVVANQSEGVPAEDRQNTKGPSLLICVKKTNAAALGTASPTSMTMVTESMAEIENELYMHGLGPILSKYRQKWVDNGKQAYWSQFASRLSKLYPSGRMPDVPRPNAEFGVPVALKIATIENLNLGQQVPYSPLSGDEAWTRDDDNFWDVITITRG